jgi:hypothetical protein
VQGSARSLTRAEAEIELARWSASLATDPLKWAEQAFPWGEGDLAGRALEQWQRDFLTDLGEQIRTHGFDGQHSVPPVQMAVGSGHGTGKSALSSILVLFIMSTRPQCKGVVTANTQTQLETKTWAELALWKRRCRTGHWFNLTSGRGAMRMSHVRAPETWRVDAIPNRKDASEAFAGLHAAGSTAFLVFDEASGIHDSIWTVAEGATTDGEPMWFAFGNRTRPNGRYHECWGRFKHRWNTRTIDSRDVTMTSKKRIQDWIDDHGEDSDFVRIRVRGLPPLAAATQLIGLDVIEAARKREVYVPATEQLIAGVDVAWYGSDRSVIAYRRGPDARSLPWVEMKKRDPMQVANRCAEEHETHKVDMWVVEVTGIGAGVYSRMKEMGLPVTAFDPAERYGRLDGDEIPWNQRARAYLRLRDWLRWEGAIPDTEDLASELSAQAYHTKGKEVILADKDTIRQELGRSPDESDALAFTLHVSLPPKTSPSLDEMRRVLRARTQQDRRVDALLGIRDPFDNE